MGAVPLNRYRMAGKKEVKPAVAIVAIVVVILVIGALFFAFGKKNKQETSPQSNVPTTVEDMKSKMQGGMRGTTGQ